MLPFGVCWRSLISYVRTEERAGRRHGTRRLEHPSRSRTPQRAHSGQAATRSSEPQDFARCARKRLHLWRVRTCRLRARPDARIAHRRLLGSRLLRARNFLLPALQAAAAHARRNVAIRVYLPRGAVLRGAGLFAQVLAAAKVLVREGGPARGTHVLHGRRVLYSPKHAVGPVPASPSRPRAARA